MPMKTPTLHLLAFCLALAASTEAQAALFKCKDNAGKTTYQETPCASNTTQKKIAKDTPADSRAGTITGISGSATDKMLQLNKQASGETLNGCVKFHRPDLGDDLSNFQVTTSMATRHWLTRAGPAERMMVNIKIREKGKLTNAEETEFSCVLRGNETVDPDATREYVESR
jgi:Domain of unknown function (DUF4124)